MFKQFAKTPAKGKKKISSGEIPLTTQFVAVCVKHKIRLSYGSLAMAAKALGENDSNQIAAQRGAALVKTLPIELQPHICRKKGDYAKGTTWATDVPSDLRDRAVIVKEDVAGAVEEWCESLAEPDADAPDADEPDHDDVVA